jgi:menaquinone-dependent protoporphyrinogen IX oxidase
MDNEELIAKVAEWVDTQVIAELIVQHLEDQGDELTLENAKTVWYLELEELGAGMAR